MFGFRMVKSSVFEWLDHSKTDLQNVRFSNGFGIRMFGIRAPTVLGYTNTGLIFFSICAKLVPSLYFFTSRCTSLYNMIFLAALD